MILKIIGSIFIIASTGLMGLYWGNLETYRIGDLQELKKALAILKSEIEFLLMPLPEALSHVAERTKSPLSGVFAKMSDELQGRSQESVGNLWEQSLVAHEPELFFSREDFEHIAAFGRTLGYLDLGMQLSSINILNDYIESTTESLKEIRDKNRKTYRSLGLLGGLLVVIVFI